MGTMSRKQREIQEREQLLLRVARGMLVEQGYAGLSLDQLAQATEYSKGTIYQHFSTKEDLVTALAIESMERRVELFLRAEQFNGKSRERLLAIGVADEIFGRMDPHHYKSEFIIKLANLQERASAERRQALERLESSCFGCVLRIVQSGIDAGELPKNVRPTELVYSVITMALGTHMTMVNYCSMLNEFKITEPSRQLVANIHTLLDGYGWRPFQNEMDYFASYQRIAAEVFAPEIQQLSAKSASNELN